jgi:putative transcriptional regulator
MDRTLLSLQQAASIARSSRRGGRKRWSQPRGPEIKQLRERLGFSQAEFARRFGLDLASLKNWERERRIPEQGNCLLLRMIEEDPGTVARLVRRVQVKTEEDEVEIA